MNSVMNVSADVTMSSLDFLKDVINPARMVQGEPEVKNAHFVARVEDELDDLPAVKTINRYGNTVKYYELTMEQMMLVGMRESKAVRRAVLAKLKEMEVQRTAFPVPKTFTEAMELALVEMKKVEALTEQVAQLETNVTALELQFTDGGTIFDFGKELNGVNARDLQRFLMGEGWLFDRNNGRGQASFGTTAKTRDKQWARDKLNGYYINDYGDKVQLYKVLLLEEGKRKLWDMYTKDKLPMKKSWDKKYHWTV